jgi:hypothetical protein
MEAEYLRNADNTHHMYVIPRLKNRISVKKINHDESLKPLNIQLCSVGKVNVVPAPNNGDIKENRGSGD